MELNKRTYLSAFTILGLAMCLYSGLQLVGAYVYVLASDWISGLEAGGFRWLSGLFASPLTKVPVQYLFVLGIPSLLVYLSVCWLPASGGTRKKVPASAIAAALVMAMGFGYVFNFTGTIINFGISLATGKSALEMNPVTEMLSMLDLRQERDKYAGSLPLGWKQKLSFCIALIHDPRIIFLDEPTGGVDPETRRRFWELIYDTAEKGTTIFVTTHYMDEAEYCDRVSVMVDGKIAALDSPENLKTRFSARNMDEVFRIIAGRAEREERP